ncbi:hypothetical protein [Streptomyces blastmyceticus]|uniref:Integral membrane protein n=1 Tax=Streptomyces blastmyceticus TaxID=68180 RepID=A0ABP3HT01_9ACTN
MSGDEPYAGHDPAAVLLLSIAGIITVLGLVTYGVVLLVRARAERTTGAAFKATATLAWAAAIGMYTWGILHLFFFNETDQAQACNAAIGKRQLSGYVATFIPLHFGCRTKGGRIVEAIIPEYINPAVTALGACAVILTGFAIRKYQEAKK